MAKIARTRRGIKGTLAGSRFRHGYAEPGPDGWRLLRVPVPVRAITPTGAPAIALPMMPVAVDPATGADESSGQAECESTSAKGAEKHVHRLGKKCIGPARLGPCKKKTVFAFSGRDAQGAYRPDIACSDHADPPPPFTHTACHGVPSRSKSLSAARRQ